MHGTASAEPMRKRLIGIFIGILALGTIPGAQQPAGGLDPVAIRTAIERSLAVTPRGIAALPPAQLGVRVTDVTVERLAAGQDRITIDLNQTALTYAAGGTLEALTTQVIESTAALTVGSRHVDYRFLVGGLPLDQFAPRSPQSIGAQQAGVARRVVISAGHGWYRDEGFAVWRLQRDYHWGIVEDFVNFDITHYLKNELIASGFDVRTARNPDRHAGAGVSGYARWQEGAKYYVRDLGAPASTWDFGVDDYAKDINSRPFYANWIDAGLLVSIHNNGGGSSGTETWYDSMNGHEADSRRLAQIVNDRVVAAIRARYDPQWVDRGLRSCNGCKGENRLAARPAVIVEIAFMDTKSPDNDALHSESFKLFVAQAIRDAIQEFTGAAAGEDADAQGRRELLARAAQDPRFGAAIDGSFGADPNWQEQWELRWLEFEFAGGRRVRLYHSTSTLDRSARYTGFWDPDTGSWQGWDPL